MEKYKNFNYVRGTKNDAENIEFEIFSNSGDYVTTCVVNVSRLRKGIKTHPCGDGDDFQLGGTTLANVLKTLREAGIRLNVAVF